MRDGTAGPEGRSTRKPVNLGSGPNRLLPGKATVDTYRGVFGPPSLTPLRQAWIEINRSSVNSLTDQCGPSLVLPESLTPP